MLICRWHKINIPDTSRPSTMTHRMMKRKKPCQKPFPSLPCYEICIIVTSITWERTPFDNDTHTRINSNVTTSRIKYICTYTYYYIHFIIWIISYLISCPSSIVLMKYIASMKIKQNCFLLSIENARLVLIDKNTKHIAY